MRYFTQTERRDGDKEKRVHGGGDVDGVRDEERERGETQNCRCRVGERKTWLLEKGR